MRAWIGFLLACLVVLATPAIAQQRSMLPVTIDGEIVKLTIITHKPAGNGPFAVLISHHGSTGSGRAPAASGR